MKIENIEHTKQQISDIGFTVINDVFSDVEIKEILAIIDHANTEKATFRKSKDLFAIRQFLKEIPKIQNIIFNDTFKKIINSLFGEDYFVVKSIYFDKPPQSNWFVPYHQDLTISVDKKVEIPDFEHWTIKQNQFSVQPTLDYLQDNFTIRIHLDDTNEQNGALKVVPKSHAKGIYKPENIDWTTETEVSCNTQKGGIMIMRPLLLHASNKTTNNKKRRVIHIEFSNKELKNINWAERLDFMKI